VVPHTEALQPNFSQRFAIAFAEQHATTAKHCVGVKKLGSWAPMWGLLCAGALGDLSADLRLYPAMI